MKINELIDKHGRILSFASDQYIFHQGDLDNSLYVVKSGLLKAYYISNEGKQSIKSFLLPGDTIGSLTAAKEKKGCSFSLRCLQASTLMCIDFDTLYRLSKQDIELAGNMLDILLDFGMRKEKREYEFLCLSPQERYQNLLATKPKLFGLVKQSEIASYLGITPVGLSRIKTRLNNTEQKTYEQKT